MISGILAMIILCSLFVLVLFVFAMAISHEDKLSVLKGVYIYVVSIISLGVFLIGLGMGIYNLLGQYVFPKAIDAEYKYILQECDRGYMTEPVKVDKTGTGTMLDNQTSIQDKVKCEEEKRARIEEEKEIDFSRNMLTAFIFILIGLPIYLLHFFYFRKNI